MAINPDTLLDRLYLKSQITRWRMLAVVFGVAALLMLNGRYGGAHSPMEREFIARISLEGIITDDQKLYELIDDTASSPKAKAVIVWLDTPGGSAVGGEETYLRLRALAEKRPVVAVMRSLSASAGYMAALGADYILAREGTITGSIGVIVESAEITELVEKLGIKPIIVKSSPLKGSPSPLEKSTPDAERAIKDVVNDFYNRFVDIVADRRKLPRDQVVAIADGRVYSGKSAFQRKLIDAIGGEQEAINWLNTQKHIREDMDIKDIEIKEDLHFLEGFTQSIAGFFFPKSSVMLDGMLAIWHPHVH